MKLLDFCLKKDDFITSDRIHTFVRTLLCDDIEYIKTDMIKDRQNNWVKMEGWRNRNETINLDNVRVLVSGHSDHCIDDTYTDILNSHLLSTWFCQNKNINHPKLRALPLGITNQHEPATRGRHKIIGNTDRIFSIAQEPKLDRHARLAYLNITPSNFPHERNDIVGTFAEQPWVTYRNPEITEEGHEDFLRNIHQHKFVFAPRGNGLDTHRLWECLYLRTIPIVKRHMSMCDFEDLPILFVDDWKDVTEEYLHHVYDKMMQIEYNMEKITMDYWVNNIATALQNTEELQ